MHDDNPKFKSVEEKKVEDYRTQYEEKPAQIINKTEHNHYWHAVPELIIVLMIVFMLQHGQEA